MKELHSQGLVDSLGIDIITLEKGYVTATMPVDERTRQPFGYLHGGASVALAETVASIGAYQLIDQETQNCFGLEINANHVRSKRDGIVTAEGKILHQGRTTQIWEIQIKDENGKMICISRCTIAVVPRKQD